MSLVRAIEYLRQNGAHKQPSQSCGFVRSLDRHSFTFNTLERCITLRWPVYSIAYTAQQSICMLLSIDPIGQTFRR